MLGFKFLLGSNGSSTTFWWRNYKIRPTCLESKTKPRTSTLGSLCIVHMSLCTVHKLMCNGASNTPPPTPRAWGVGGGTLVVWGRGVFEAPVPMSLCSVHEHTCTVHKLPKVEAHGFALPPTHCILTECHQRSYPLGSLGARELCQRGSCKRGL